MLWPATGEAPNEDLPEMLIAQLLPGDGEDGATEAPVDRTRLCDGDR